MQRMNKKGQTFALAALGTLAVLLVVGFLTAGIGARVVEKTDDVFTEGTVADNISQQGAQGLQQFAEFAPIIGLVVVAAIVIGIVKQF